MLADQFNNRCAVHILNISIKAGTKHVSEEIKLAHSFCKKLIFTALEKPFLMPEIDCATCWNSTMLSFHCHS